MCSSSEKSPSWRPPAKHCGNKVGKNHPETRIIMELRKPSVTAELLGLVTVKVHFQWHLREDDVQDPDGSGVIFSKK